MARGRGKRGRGKASAASSGGPGPGAEAADVIPINGAALEGGGQVVRVALSLAWLVGRPMTIRSIRAGRPRPGLGHQHLCGVRLVARLCGFSLEGDAKGSTTVHVRPGGSPWAEPTLVAEVGTAGAATLLLQAALPPLSLRAAPVELVLRGGTDVPFSPPASHASLVLAPLLRRMGLGLEVVVARRGFNPAGGGELRVRCARTEPALRALELLERGQLTGVHVVVACGGLGASEEQSEAEARVARLVGEAVQERLGTLAELAGVEVVVELDEGNGAQGSAEDGGGGGGGGRGRGTVACSVQLVAATETGCRLSCNALRDVRPPEAASQGAELAAGLAADLRTLLASGACVDEHTADQLVVFMALAEGVSRVRVAPAPPGAESLHLPTAVHFAQALVSGAAFTVSEAGAEAACKLVECRGAAVKAATA